MSTSQSKVREAKLELYRKKGKIHAKATQGVFNTWRWSVVGLSQILFLGACWLEWREGDTARQAILFDIAHEKFYVFDTVFWPQDALLLAFLLILAATALFCVTALAGRLFCGFACPQTIYTAIFVWIEARVEGDHLARLKLDREAMHARKLRLKLLKHSLWLIFAAWTGITFVGYFTPIRDFLPALGQGQAGPWESFWLIFYSAFTYIQAGLAREAVCQHMCPYSRFQGVMFDPDTRSIAYDPQRGEPRSRSNLNAGGDCIDCAICVEVCPTGIDIRQGLQYPCINCGLCADACNQVMRRIGKAPGLIRFMSEAETQGMPNSPSLFRRPRLLAYASVFLVVSGALLWSLTQRSLLLVDVLRDRGALARETAEGTIENAYQLKLMNLDGAAHRYRIEVQGLPGIRLMSNELVTVEAGTIRSVPVTVALAAPSTPRGIQPIRFRVIAEDEASIAADEKSSFALP